jgi:hypothetical protein
VLPLQTTLTATRLHFFVMRFLGVRDGQASVSERSGWRILWTRGSVMRAVWHGVSGNLCICDVDCWHGQFVDAVRITTRISRAERKMMITETRGNEASASCDGYPFFQYTPKPWVWNNGELRRARRPLDDKYEVVLCPGNTSDFEEYENQLGPEYWLRALGAINTENESPWNASLLRNAPDMFEALQAIADGDGDARAIASGIIKQVTSP